MRLDAWNLAAFVAMALVTYACRGGGYWLFRQVRPSPLVRAVLGYIPGTLFVSYVVPALAAGTLPPWVGAAATLAVMAFTRSMLWAVLVGTGATWGVWALR